jgi:flavodoxin I
MKALILYASASATKNTKEIARLIFEEMQASGIETDCFSIREFDELEAIKSYDIVVVGTYSWGNGRIPRQMRRLAEYFEENPDKTLVTGVFGSGDTFYPKFCGAVDEFKALLADKTNLAVTLKVELFPQERDIAKMGKFVELLKARCQSL